jgi:hypothetical protein
MAPKEKGCWKKKIHILLYEGSYVAGKRMVCIRKLYMLEKGSYICRKTKDTVFSWELGSFIVGKGKVNCWK